MDKLNLLSATTSKGYLLMYALFLPTYIPFFMTFPFAVIHLIYYQNSYSFGGATPSNFMSLQINGTLTSMYTLGIGKRERDLLISIL
jgi:hypothetical protein